MAAVRDFADELEGYAYLPRMFDKAARTGITAAETVLGSRLPFFADTVRY